FSIPDLMAVHIFGIRHHGPGSARHLVAELEAFQPDMILVEGPPEANGLIPFLADPELQPPVAILAYKTNEPSQAVFYPFAAFSPEWQALQFALAHNLHVQFFDLPVGYWLGKPEIENPESTVPRPSGNPFDALARAAGKPSGEHWWDETVETRRSPGTQIFPAIQHAITALRDIHPDHTSPRDLLREAWMRQVVRKVQKAGYKNIAVVCGAWHGPALENLPPAKEDKELLQGLTLEKVEATWVPWTFARLTFASGYGAGLVAPGWYNHLWDHPNDEGEYWLSMVAAILRKAGKDTSTAHVVEASRLATTLASLRNLTRPGLQEFNDAIVAVMGMGDPLLLHFLKDELLVGDQIGSTPDSIPRVPLVQDVEQLQRKLRLRPSAEEKELLLDLRKETDLERSTMLHRLHLLGITWGRAMSASGTGTFKEQWLLKWHPEFHIRLVEQGIWGNTLQGACTAFLADRATHSQSMPEIVTILGNAIVADLPDAVTHLIDRLETLAATSSDIANLMESVSGLTSIIRYGNVRNTSIPALDDMLGAIVVRICIGLPYACTGIAEEVATGLFPLIRSTDEAIGILGSEDTLALWLGALRQLYSSSLSQPLLGGLAMQITYRRNQLSPETLEKALHFHFSSTSDPSASASWLEGFLSESGTVLLIDQALWSAVYGWVDTLSEDHFLALLPLLRRTFSTFSASEKRKIGTQAQQGAGGPASVETASVPIDAEAGLKAAKTVLSFFQLSSDLS
ncbi:MAG: DUF5682 family protein, partial [Bacteroidia bacterium]|nr:DUF5682 family protein [Bacteroidia bacterium]